jgi:ABC-type proline/glycine betaine transport system permease subunit
MGTGRKIMAGIALIVAAMVVKRYMKKKEKERNETDRETWTYHLP